MAAVGLSAAAIWAIVGAAISAVGVGVGTWQQLEQRNQQAEEAEALEEQKQKEAKAAADTAAYQEQQHRRRMGLLAGKQRAITAAAGVSGGSPLEADLDLATQSELEALTLRRQGKLESQAKDFEARLAHYRADVARGQRGYDVAGGVLQAASGAASAYSSYKGYNQYRRQMFTDYGSDAARYGTLGARG